MWEEAIDFSFMKLLIELKTDCINDEERDAIKSINDVRERFWSWYISCEFNVEVTIWNLIFCGDKACH